MLSVLEFWPGHQDAGTNSSHLLHSTPHLPRSTHLSWLHQVCPWPTGKSWVRTQSLRDWEDYGIMMGLARTQRNPSPATNQPLPPQGPWGKGVHRKQSKAKPHFIISWGWPQALSRTPAKTVWAGSSLRELEKHKDHLWMVTPRSQTKLQTRTSHHDTWERRKTGKKNKVTDSVPRME